jgi:NNP family nitrate/nitrite transporter-like MFS transporter
MKTKWPKKYAALVLATLLLAVNFWAWSLVSPLATQYAKEFSLSPFMLSVLVAAPVMVGSLGRVPLGLLADRYGGRRMFAVVCLLSAVVVVWLGVVGSASGLLSAAFALGIAGASFAAGVPFVNGWFPKQERGLALGVYAMGNAGTAVSGLLTPHLAAAMGRNHLFWLVAALLLAAGVAMALGGHEGPGWQPAKSNNWQRLKQACAWKLTWRLSLLYAVTFGAFVSLGLYLPVLLNQSYGLEPTDAAARAAGFVLLATMVRPIGGWLSDKFSGLVVIRAVFGMLCGLACLAALQPSLAPIGTIAYLGMSVVLGIGNGAIFAVIGHRCNGKIVGTVTGIVGAAGGLGGYFPPLVMGASYQLFHNYTPALLLLAVASSMIFISLHRLFGYTTKY